MARRGAKPKRREVVWSPEFAYAVGLMTSDGCLSNDERHLSLVSKDIEQIENLKRCLNLKVKIGIHRAGARMHNRTYHRIQWGDVVLYNFLLDIGLTPHKSRTVGMLAIPDTYFFDFLRGSFDGDGSFYSYYDPRWKSSFMFYLTFLSASPRHIEWLRESAERFSGVRGHISTSGKLGHRIQSLRYAKKEALLLLERMYKNPKAVSLSRKKLKIAHALRIVGKSLPKSRKNLTK
jgi:hypothetical protein